MPTKQPAKPIAKTAAKPTKTTELAVNRKPNPAAEPKTAKPPSSIPAKWIPLKSIIFDEAYQMRVTQPDTSEYRELLDECQPHIWPFDLPILVASIKGKLKVVEGFTRGLAAKEAGRKDVYCRVLECTADEATRIALGSNSKHGLRRTNADKNNAVRIAVAKYSDKSAVDIAAICNVSHTFVYSIMSELKGQEPKAKELEQEPKAATAATKAEPKAATKQPESDFPEYAEPSKNGNHQKPPVSGVVSKSESSPASTVDQAVNLTAQRLKQARSAIGVMTRTLESLGLLEKVKPLVDQMLKDLK